ncbi:MAG: prepilin-type N-terminal cleavage/methylation domain-containing protein [Betaproteobacteria bacterium]|jgi:general secretion pathway protein J|nr:MAG: prepilin-type N-terminal cleavage/methylation domain-containing protein [Betaproteobacteria bacterium]
MKKQSVGGFTLVELLVAVSLLGLLGIISWRGLDHVIGQRVRISEQDAQIERLIRTIGQLERDFDECLADALLSSASDEPSPLPKCLALTRNQHSGEAVTIVRAHPSGTGYSSVRYGLEGNDLIRSTTSNRNSQSDRVLLLSDVVSFEARLFSAGGWVDFAEQSDSRATAIEISIERTEAGRYTKVIVL